MSPEEIFKADDTLAERIEQAADQPDVPRQARLRGEVIEIDGDRLRRGRREDCIDIGDETVVMDALVIKWRQHQSAGETELGGMLGQRDGIGQRGRAGSDHHPIERQAGRRVGAHHAAALVERKRGRLARGAEYIEAVAAGIEKKARQRCRTGAVGFALVIDGGCDRGDHAVECLGHGCSYRLNGGRAACAGCRSSKAYRGDVQSSAVRCPSAVSRRAAPPGIWELK